MTERICVEKIFPHHIDIVNSGDEKSRAAFFSSKVWDKDATITIGFLGDGQGILKTSLDTFKGKQLDPLENDISKLSAQEAVRKVVNERIAPACGLKLVFVPQDQSHSANIRISFDSSEGAWSLIGKDCLDETSGAATMNLGWLDIPTIIHEFGHAVFAMIHEHQNPRGGIKWNVDAVYQWAKEKQGWDKQTTYNNILMKYNTDQINGSQFDPLSIMLYFFPANLTLDNKGTQQNARLSPLDVIWVHKTYPKGEDPNTFYEQVYGEDIGNIVVDNGGQGNSFNLGKYLPWILGVIMILFILLLVIRLIRRRRVTTRKVNTRYIN